MNFKAIDHLCLHSQAFAFGPDNDQLFLEAMRENYQWQWSRQPFLRWLGQRHGFGPEDLQTYEDIFRIPPLFVGLMKTHNFASCPKEDIVLELTSSGTAGQKTRSFFDQDSLKRIEALSREVFTATGFVSQTPAHTFIFNYDPSQARDLGTAWSAEQKAALAPSLTRHFTIARSGPGRDFDFDSERWAHELAAVPGHEPVRLIGFPAFIHRCVLDVERLHPQFRVHPQSFAICGGGWKNHQGQSMTHGQFASFLEDKIGLPAANVRDTFGMAEHGIPYAACSSGHHHQPVYGRLAVVDPLTLKPLPPGQEGLLLLLTPYNTAQANLSVLSTDVASLALDCPCGLPGPYLASIRRGGVRKYKGCAIAAQEILSAGAKS